MCTLTASVFGAVLVISPVARTEMSGNAKNSEAVEEVLSGKRTVANAAWWGFDQEDATESLQEAINSHMAVF